MPLSLVVAHPDGGSRQVPLEGVAELRIGRAPKQNEVVLPSAGISRRHARIVVRDGRILIVDLKSTNGTYVNGRRVISPMVVQRGDRIRMGEFEARIEQLDGPAPPPPPAPSPSPLDREPTPPAKRPPPVPSAPRRTHPPTPSPPAPMALEERTQWRALLVAAVSAGAEAEAAVRIADALIEVERARR